MPPVAMSSKDDLSYKSSLSNAAFFPYSSNTNPFHVSDFGISRFNCISGKRSWKNYSKQRLAKC